MTSPPFSILLLTLNEEGNLPRCLEAVSWCDDIVVVDSFSCDRTVEIARERGARVVQRKFDDFAGQRNFALQTLDFKYNWVFHLDADEVFTDELRREVESVVCEDRYEAFRVPSKTIFQGRWMRFSGMYPTYQVRLTRRPNFRFRQVGHGQKEDLGPERIGILENAYIHYSFSKGMDDWFDKHNRYSRLEAIESLRHHPEGSMGWKDFFSGDPARRRSALRKISYRLPFRPLFRFVYMYLLRFGFLDGAAGFRYCCLLAVYELMIEIKMKEIREKIGG